MYKLPKRRIEEVHITAPRLEDYPHQYAEHWLNEQASPPPGWYLIGRRMILRNGCKVTVRTGDGNWMSLVKHVITVDEGRLPEDKEYLLRVCTGREGAGFIYLNRTGPDEWTLEAI